MRKRRVVVSAGGAVALSMVVAVAPAGASDTGVATQTTAGKYCVSVLGKAPAGQESPELYRHCSTTPFDTSAHLNGAAAQAGLRGRLAASGAPAGLAETMARASVRLLIVRAYADAGFAGTYWDYYADDDDGRCDSSGYLWRPDDYWSTHLSSLEKSSGTYCNTATLVTRDKASSGNVDLPAANLSGTFNDNVGRMQIFDGNGRP